MRLGFFTSLIQLGLKITLEYGLLLLCKATNVTMKLVYSTVSSY
jgi:hypothetical protein